MKNVTLVTYDTVLFRGQHKTVKVWFQMRGNQQHFFKQIAGHKIKRITSKKEKEELKWYYNRYYPNGDRI